MFIIYNLLYTVPAGPGCIANYTNYRHPTRTAIHLAAAKFNPLHIFSPGLRLLYTAYIEL